MMQMKKEDLIGRMYGNLEVLSEAPQVKYTRYVMCKCHLCGKVKRFCVVNLRKGDSTSCGCSRRTNLLGMRFGKLLVIEYVQNNNNLRRAYWKCRCDCGRELIVCGDSLKNGRTKSCGNHKKVGEENSRFKHGLTHTRLMKIYIGMKGRCYNKNNDSYQNYGGRGIIVCDEWKNDFKSFYDWSINNGYADNLTIDRIDTNGMYSPNNCRWVDRKTQCNNQRNNHYVEYKGERLTIAQLAEKYNLNAHRIVCRIALGWSVIDAIEKPIRFRKKRCTTTIT